MKLLQKILDKKITPLAEMGIDFYAQVLSDLRKSLITKAIPPNLTDAIILNLTNKRKK